MLGSEHDDSKPFAEEGYALMAAVFEVHRELSGGLSEEIYQQSLEVELESRGVPFSSKTELSVFYQGTMLATRYVPDLIVHGHIIVELKSSRDLAPEHESQLINYMRITRKPVGYLVNFGRIGKVQWKRFVLSEYLNPDAKPDPATPQSNSIRVH